MHQSTLLERHPRAKGKIPTRTYLRREDRRTSNVRAFRRFGCREYEDEGGEGRWGVLAQWNQDVDHECLSSVSYELEDKMSMAIDDSIRDQTPTL